jgi:hypothetical protein
MYEIDSDEMVVIAEQAKVPFTVIETMFVGQPVKRSEAISVLKAFSELVADTWMLSDTRIPALPPESEEEQL